MSESHAKRREPSHMSEICYKVSGISCEHCVQAITGEVGQVPGVREVAVDLETKLVTVRGEELDDPALRAAIDEAGYDAVPA
jgi:copper chaperone